jgi:hypothetical protein
MTVDKEFITTLIAIAAATAAIMTRMGKLATKEDLKDLDKKFDSFRSEVASELRAVRSDITIVIRMYGDHGERIARVEERKAS